MKSTLVCLIILLTFQLAIGQGTSNNQRLKPLNVKGKWGYSDAKGKMVIPAQFDQALPFNDGLARVALKIEENKEPKRNPEFKWGFIDETGRITIPIQYAELGDFAEGLAAAAVLSAEKNDRPFYRQLREDNFRWGYIDKSGKIVIPMQFRYGGFFSEGLAAVDVNEDNASLCRRDSKIGYIDKTGAIVIKPIYAGGQPFHNGKARVSIGKTCYVGRCLCCAPIFQGTYGYIDKHGTFVPEDPKAEEHLYRPCYDS